MSKAARIAFYTLQEEVMKSLLSSNPEEQVKALDAISDDFGKALALLAKDEESAKELSAIMMMRTLEVVARTTTKLNELMLATKDDHTRAAEISEAAIARAAKGNDA